MRIIVMLTLLIVFLSVKAFCGGCPEGTKTINFNTPSSINLTACTDKDKFMGNQGVRWGIKNNTSDKIEVKFEKVYGISCGKQEISKADITLKPQEAIGGGYFSGHIDLGDPVFPADICGKGAWLSSVAVINLSITNLSTQEREAQARREQEERRQREQQLAEQLAEQRRAAQIKEQERLDRERERVREAERQAEIERKRAVQQNLDYIDNLVNQQKAQSDASYNNYSQNASQRISDLKNKQDEIDRELENIQADKERNEREMNYEIERKRRELDSSRRDETEANAELNNTVNSYLNSFK